LGIGGDKTDLPLATTLVFVLLKKNCSQTWKSRKNVGEVKEWRVYATSVCFECLYVNVFSQREVPLSLITGKNLQWMRAHLTNSHIVCLSGNPK